MTTYVGPEEVADRFGITVELVKKRCGDPKNPWPHMRPSRSVWRFTEDDIAEIERRVHVTGIRSVDAWGRTGRRSA